MYINLRIKNEPHECLVQQKLFPSSDCNCWPWAWNLEYKILFKKYPYLSCSNLIEILRIRGGGGIGFQKPNFLEESIKLNWNFQEVGRRNSSVERYWYFLCLHQGNRIHDVWTAVQRTDQWSDQACCWTLWLSAVLLPHPFYGWRWVFSVYIVHS